MITATTAFIAMLCVGVMILLRNYKPNLLNKVLIGILVYWIVLFGGILIDLSFNSETILNMTCLLEYRRMYSGIIALFVYMLYPVIAVYPRFFISPNILLSLSPFVVSCVIYHIWCYLNGVDASYHFISLDDLLALENRTILMFRLVIFACFYIFFISCLLSFRRITILYQRYIDGVYSDAQYNILWLKKYIMSMAIIGCAFTAVAIYTSVPTYWLYIIGTVANFMVLCDNALKHEQFERSKEYEVAWSFGKGWHVKQNDISLDQIPKATSSAEEKAFVKFEKWIHSVEAYDLCSFTLNEVKDHFPELDYYAMERQLAARGHTFQSYIRSMRIKRAVEIMKSNDTIPFKQIAFKVGFTHHSSFNRAFLTEMGCTPSEYRTKKH